MFGTKENYQTPKRNDTWTTTTVEYNHEDLMQSIHKDICQCLVVYLKTKEFEVSLAKTSYFGKRFVVQQLGGTLGFINLFVQPETKESVATIRFTLSVNESGEVCVSFFVFNKESKSSSLVKLKVDSRDDLPHAIFSKFPKLLSDILVEVLV